MRSGKSENYSACQLCGSPIKTSSGKNTRIRFDSFPSNSSPVGTPMNAMHSSELNYNKRLERPIEIDKLTKTSEIFISTPFVEEEIIETKNSNDKIEVSSSDLSIRQKAQERFQSRMQRLHKSLLLKNEAAEISEDLIRSEIRKQEMNSARTALLELNQDLQTLVEFVAKLIESNSNESQEKLLRVRLKTLTEELYTLKEKNSKLKELAAGLLGKQLNFKDARIALLQADLEERQRQIEVLEKKENDGLQNEQSEKKEFERKFQKEDVIFNRTQERDFVSQKEISRTSSKNEEVTKRKNKS